ncbi:hypothetical protein D0A34_03040 [Microcoleus vaginatus PCC 9802]|nr:hypothetical protein D0A34_03040 [Microcoleus vaginatus PCC 9802]
MMPATAVVTNIFTIFFIALFGNLFARSPALSGLILIGLTQTLLDALRCSETGFFLPKLHKETRFLS